jgi:NAD(P)-dependent dehydrogenase (short-subunit alcohol dehydrogenase family)
VELVTKRTLILGDISSLAQILCRFEKGESFEDTATYRDSLCKNRDIHINWLNLELSEKSSIENFLVEIRDSKFERVFSLISEITNKYFLNISYTKLSKYYSTYVVNSLYLLQNCLSNIHPTSNIFFMSSRARANASYDVHYSAVKSALEGYVRSSARALSSNQGIIGISSGLIQNARMHLDMKPEHRKSHKERVRDTLITVEELCSQIWNLSAGKSSENNDQIIHLGPAY